MFFSMLVCITMVEYHHSPWHVHAQAGQRISGDIVFDADDEYGLSEVRTFSYGGYRLFGGVLGLGIM